MLRTTRNILAIAILALPNASYAEDLFTVTVGETSEALTFDDLLAMPQVKVITKNDYVDDKVEFSGPLLRDLLVNYNIVPGDILLLRAINDFSVKIPASDAFEYNVILALFSDGQKMSIRDKGPIWLIYPMDDHEELRDDSYNSRIIWQLTSLSVE